MTKMMQTTTLELDPLNPAQFYACCGLLELAAARNRNVMAAFGYDHRQPRKARFSLHGVELEDLTERLVAIKQATATVTGIVDGESPVSMVLPDGFSMVLDWWLLPDRKAKSRLKLWAGQQTTLKLVEDMLRAEWGELNINILENRVPMSGRFGIDPRSSWNTLDFGSSLNIQTPDPYTYPATEMLAAIGLQGFRPRTVKGGYGYRLWTNPLPLVPARMAAALDIPTNSGDTFMYQVEKRSGSYSCFTFSQPQ